MLHGSLGDERYYFSEMFDPRLSKPRLIDVAASWLE